MVVALQCFYELKHTVFVINMDVVLLIFVALVNARSRARIGGEKTPENHIAVYPTVPSRNTTPILFSFSSDVQSLESYEDSSSSAISMDGCSIQAGVPHENL